MEYLNNLLNSNTQSGGVYAVSMHQLNQILQLSSAYFNRFDDNTKQQYIKLFGFTPLSLLKGHSSSKMPQYRERFIFLIYLQFCVLLMMNNTAGMETKEEVLKYLSKLCKEFNISKDNKICKNINDALTGSTGSTGSTSTGSTKDYNIDEAFDFILSKLNDDDKIIVNKMLNKAKEDENNIYKFGGAEDVDEDEDEDDLRKFITEKFSLKVFNDLKNILDIYDKFDYVKKYKLEIIFFTFFNVNEYIQLTEENNEDNLNNFVKENINKYIIKDEVLRIENDKIVVKLNDNLNVELLKKYLQIEQLKRKEEEEEAKRQGKEEESKDNDTGSLRTKSANSNTYSSRTSTDTRKSNINEEEKKKEIINKIKTEFVKAIQSEQIKNIYNENKHVNELTSDQLEKIYDKLCADKTRKEIKADYKDLLNNNIPYMDYINLFGVEINSSHKNIDILDKFHLLVLKQQFNNVRTAEQELKKKITDSPKYKTLINEQKDKMNNILQNFKDLHIDNKAKIIEIMKYDGTISTNEKIDKILEYIDEEIYTDDEKETVDLHSEVVDNFGLDGGSYNNIDITNTLQDIF